MISVTGSLRRAGPVAGVWQAKLRYELSSASQGVVYPQGIFVSGRLVTQENEPSFDFKAPDGGGLMPPMATIELRIDLDDGAQLTYLVPLDKGDIDLSSLVEVDRSEDDARFRLVGVPGGVAVLDEQGRVVDANGRPVGDGGTYDLSEYVTEAELQGVVNGLPIPSNLSAVAYSGQSIDLIRPPTISPLASYRNGTI